MKEGQWHKVVENDSSNQRFRQQSHYIGRQGEVRLHTMANAFTDSSLQFLGGR